MSSKKNKRTYRSFDEVTEEYYRAHPEEIDDFLAIAFEEYAKDNFTPALLSSLRMIARIKGVSDIARSTGISRNGIQKALSETGNPKFESVYSIMGALGYCLMPQRMENRL